MAIDLRDITHRTKLRQVIRQNHELEQPARERRKGLIDVYRDRPSWWRAVDDPKRTRTLVNNFQQFVRGHITSLAFNVPKWSVSPRTQQGKGMDILIQELLNRLNELLGMQSLLERWALDTAFGRCVGKVVEGIAPKGIYVPVSPRAYRISPDSLILDQTASNIDECLFVADTYLVPFNEVMGHPGFDPEVKRAVTPWSDRSGRDSFLPEDHDISSLAEDMTRLIDVYIPSQGIIATWPTNSDSFGEISNLPPLQTRTTPVNPYSIMDATMIPEELEEFALLDTLRPLHELSNDMLIKAATQARNSKRNPMFKLGSEHDMDTALRAPDNEPVGIDNPEDLDVFVLPGPDQSLVSLGQLALGLFSQYGGNLEVALGQSAGADTARQTQALIQQINSVQGVIRGRFERFISSIGQKLATLAFESEIFELNMSTQVPGTTLSVNWGWGPPERLPRVATVDDFHFKVVPYSTGYRSPQEHLQQLEAATAGILQWAQAAGQGFPINLKAVTESYSEAFDLVTELPEWLSGDQQTPQEKASNIYQSTAQKNGPSQREISYSGKDGGGKSVEIPQNQLQPGLQNRGQ